MIETTTFTVTPKPPYNFKATVNSHGWIELAPNQRDQSITRVEKGRTMQYGTIVLLTVIGSRSVTDPRVDDAPWT